MPADKPTILATSGGMRAGSRTYYEFDALLHHAIDLAGVSGRAPRVTHVPTACGDQRWLGAEFADAARAAGAQATNLYLFPMPNLEDIEGHLLEQDVIWVNGGSVAGLLAMWELHELGPMLRRVWEAGVVLAGVSAGSICWFTGGTTDSFGPQLRAVINGLGFLPYGNGVHYDSEERRRPLVHELVGNGTLPTTHCTDDGVGLVYHGTELVEAVSEVGGKAAYIVSAESDTVREERLEPRRLPSP